MSRPLALRLAASSLSLAQVWRASDLALAPGKVVPSGHKPLDAQLPGGGWPLGELVEVLQQHEHQHAWQLLAPALAQALKNETGPVVLVGAPYEPFGPSLAAQGIDAGQLLVVKTGKPAARLWAAEQALRCAEVAAVVAWLPKANATELRRLHIAAQQQSRLLFVFRPLAARNASTPARVQLLVQGTKDMEVTILKRRGPPMLQPVHLPAHPERLAALLQSRKGQAQVQGLGSAPAIPLPTKRSRSLVLDRPLTHA